MSYLNDDNVIYGNITVNSNTSPYVISSGAVGAGYTWATGTNSIDWSIGTKVDQSGTMELKGDNADIVVNGRSLMSAIDALEQRLNIMVPNPELEAEWDELKELGDRYRELEKQCKEKGNMWSKLKEIKK
jgi:hypothetical protein